jgi:hypothetical protein
VFPFYGSQKIRNELWAKGIMPQQFLKQTEFKGGQNMKKRKISVLLVFLVSLLPFINISELNAANWYVDCSATGTNAGTSWTNAWHDFDHTVWGGAGVVAGDTLWIAGKDAACSYSQSLVPAASGSAGNPITISIGQDAGYNGVATIDKNWTGYWGIKIDSVSYITIIGQVGAGKNPMIKVTKAPYVGLTIGGTATHIDVGYVELTGNGDRQGAYGFSLGARANANIGKLHHSKIHDNFEEQMLISYSTDLNTTFDCFKIHDNEIYNFQGDALKITANGVSFYNNLVHDRLTAKTDYSDGIQFWGSWTKIYNNTFYRMIRDYNTSQPVPWQASKVYKAGDCVSKTGTNATKRYWCSIGSGSIISGTAEPNWEVSCPNNGNTCTEATGIIWKNKMGFSNNDGSYWPSHWAINSHLRYNPDTSAYAAAKYVYIYNNLFVEADTPLCSYSNLTGITFSFTDVNPTYVSNMVFSNNTLVGLPSYGLAILFNKSGTKTLTHDTVDSVYIKNNIFKNVAKNGWTTSVMAFDRGDGTITYGSHGSGADVEIDNNVIYAESGYNTGIGFPGGNGTYANFKTLSGCQINDQSSPVDPGIGSNYQVISESSKVVNAGISLYSLYTNDYSGLSRPQSSGWSIGAYEYGTPSKLPGPPANLRVQ